MILKVSVGVVRRHLGKPNKRFLYRKTYDELQVAWTCHVSFSHPDYTVGSRIALDPPFAHVRPGHGLKARAHHRRLGLSPDPEGIFVCTSPL